MSLQSDMQEFDVIIGSHVWCDPTAVSLGYGIHMC